MTISVIVVSWNAKAFLLECLESISSQGFLDGLEIIVVDNASTDGSPEAVRDRFPAVNLIRNKVNQGFARANNIGIGASRGEYIFLINSDVVVHPGCFKKMIEYMVDHPAVGMLGPRILDSSGQVQRSCMQYPSLSNALSRALALDSLFPRSKRFGSQLLTFWDHHETRSVEVINGCFWMVRRSAIGQVGLMDERFLMYGEDIDWCRRFNERGWKVVFLSEAEALHYGGASSANAPTKFYLEMQRANYEYWLKHHSALGSYAFLLINILHHTVRIVGETAGWLVVRKRRTDFSHKIGRSTESIIWACRTMAMGASKKRLQSAERTL